MNEFFLGVSVQHIQRLALANETYRQQLQTHLARDAEHSLGPARTNTLGHLSECGYRNELLSFFGLSLSPKKRDYSIGRP